MIESRSDVYLDIHGLDMLRQQSQKDGKRALKEVAGQFESIFLKMMLKSMRDASFGDPLFESEGTKFYRDMYDHQLSLELSKNGSIGLADMIVRQLGQYVPEGENQPAESKSAPQTPWGMPPLPVRPSAVSKPEKVPPQAATEVRFEAGDPASFTRALYPLAKQSAQQLGVKPEVLIAQAALETGWGKHVIQKADGSSSFNLFNIKADNRWKGGQASVQTLEFRHGVAQKERAAFRAYESFEESFSDYVAFVKNSPRYSHAINNAADASRYVEELQAAGYATDPRYADKIKRIMNREPLANAGTAALQTASLQTAIR